MVKPLMSAELKKIESVAVKAAQEATKILKFYFGKLQHITEKKQAGLVTEADKAAEEKIVSIIHKSYPTHAILGEEGGSRGPSSEFRWVIDPLDGTANYAHNIPLFCTSIGIETEGKTVVAVVSDPNHKALYTARVGKGAFKNGKKIQVSKANHLSESLLATGFAYQRGEALRHSLGILASFMEETHGIRRCGSAVWDLCQVAEGNFDGFWEKNLQPWDVAAGMLLIEEAGGSFSKYDGRSSTLDDQEIIASNGLIHQQMIEVIQKSN